ncbi:MAG: PAAR domain-containing protein [Selenomonadaceae bacterium]|nr:PAAR domain-containing protein [Selenomonadaceae bacterium]
MPRATRLGDCDTGHDFCPPRPLVSASPNVFINGKNAGRTGDSYALHKCPLHKPHVGHIASGSASVYINGKSAGRIGDAVSCGGSVAEGSRDVYIG